MPRREGARRFSKAWRFSSPQAQVCGSGACSGWLGQCQWRGHDAHWFSPVTQRMLLEQGIV